MKELSVPYGLGVEFEGGAILDHCFSEHLKYGLGSSVLLNHTMRHICNEPQHFLPLYKIRVCQRLEIVLNQGMFCFDLKTCACLCIYYIYTGWGKIRLTVVCMENNAVIND